MSDFKVHNVKIWPEFFNDMFEHKKKFEVRLNDRDYKVDDILYLCEYSPREDKYTGRILLRRIIYTTDFGCADGYIIMGVEPVNIYAYSN